MARPLPRLVAAAAAIALAGPAAATDGPADLVGVYAGRAESCAHYLADDYLTVDATSVMTAATGYDIAHWRRVGAWWEGEGTVAYEGEGPEANEAGTIRLRRLQDGGLEIDGLGTYVPCPGAASQP